MNAAVGLTQAEKLRIAASRLIDEINHLRRPLSQNGTPKRVREYQSRVHDGNNMERVRNALFALADAHEAGTISPELASLKTKKEILELVACHLDTSGGYYSANPTNEYRNKSPLAKQLQDLIAGKADPEAARKFEIAKLENEIRFVDIPGFFPTPAPLADLMVERLRIPTANGHKTRVIDPSAGKGDLIEAVLRKHKDDVQVCCFEIQPRLQAILDLKGFGVAGDDLFRWALPNPQFSRIIMNPPFEKMADVDHITWAFMQVLAPGGRLVSLCSQSPFFRDDQKADRFRQMLAANSAEVIDVGAGAFSGVQAFRQTGVNSKIVILEKR